MSTQTPPTSASAQCGKLLRAGMVGMGMIFDETYRPVFESLHRGGLCERSIGGICGVELAAVATRTGNRAEAYRESARDRIGPFVSFHGPNAIEQMLLAEKSDARSDDGGSLDFACVATPDDRHFAAARAILAAGKHLLVEKPSVLSLAELDELVRLARQNGVLAKVVYHKLLDPDHKRMRTLVADGELQHVNHGYCSLLEPKAIGKGQFVEWIWGRNPGTYVAVHYIKLIDFTFGGHLRSVACTGQRGIIGPTDGPTWDSTQLRLVYEYADGREAAFDIHTSWVTPDNFPGHVEQEVQFRFDNGVWTAHGRRRGVECTIEGRTPQPRKITPNHHYNAEVLEPWGERAARGYGLEAIERFVREVARVEFGGPQTERPGRLEAARSLDYNDLSADRQVVAAVQAMEAILARRAAGLPDAVVYVNHPAGGLALFSPGRSEPDLLYAGPV
ncbi:MAG TPA: Gfo/Idh/MocA family oxidoreductase [Pirellulales bacterium]|jgi:predicted dehydrogenase|nr:Gfo/Idh/MocA family oxidoreductase [Pirellulales bacterium]